MIGKEDKMRKNNFLFTNLYETTKW